MLDCDECHRWYHGACVGFVRDQPLLEYWACDECAMRRQLAAQQARLQARRAAAAATTSGGGAGTAGAPAAGKKRKSLAAGGAGASAASSSDGASTAAASSDGAAAAPATGTGAGNSDADAEKTLRECSGSAAAAWGGSAAAGQSIVAARRRRGLIRRGALSPTPHPPPPPPPLPPAALRAAVFRQLLLNFVTERAHDDAFARAGRRFLLARWAAEAASAGDAEGWCVGARRGRRRVGQGGSYSLARVRAADGVQLTPARALSPSPLPSARSEYFASQWALGQRVHAAAHRPPCLAPYNTLRLVLQVRGAGGVWRRRGVMRARGRSRGVSPPGAGRDTGRGALHPGD